MLIGPNAQSFASTTYNRRAAGPSCECSKWDYKLALDQRHQDPILLRS